MINKESNFISAVVCIHGKENNINDFFSMLYDVLSKNFLKYEIVCVNNGSDEETLKQVKEFKKLHEEVILTVLNLGFRHDIESAMSGGGDLAIGDFVLEFDSTYRDYDIDMIMNIYFKALDGYTV